jgi:hypothetical protein
MGNQISQTRCGPQAVCKVQFEDVSIGQDRESVAITPRHVPALVSEPMHREGDRFLQRDEQIQHHNLSRSSIREEIFCGAWKHLSDAGDCVANRRELLG